MVALGKVKRDDELIKGSSQEGLQKLSEHHPLIIEGMGGYDTRDPSVVASTIHDQLRKHWEKTSPQKPPILVTQGDPLEERGISAITRIMSDRLGIPRILIYLDPSIASYHAPNADRYGVSYEISFSVLRDRLHREDSKIVLSITNVVDEYLQNKTVKRLAEGNDKLPDYYRDFALLQEITKVACKKISGELTVAHTSSALSEFSVSSFYRVGLDLGMIDSSEMVPFPADTHVSR
ncbi:MAG TPA: shikimate kinase [Halieaceae bacterium]|nr:shikimate kinase [Halieaceae bacterium]|tara:strand:+ start:319 stop:1023 length:705 start_codon:yes stop_codon:yes gene_type:complete